ncbi:MAG: N-formylglutamate deformylase [Hyphomicrobiales bacterium]
MTPVAVSRGRGPSILGQPHGGTFVPAEIAARFNDNGRALADTDWHITQLYDGLLPDATVVEARFHRYVIDANRDPAGHSLYPGQNTTGLCPVTDFDGAAIWQENAQPTDEDIAARLADFHAPYHAALTAEVARVKALHGVALVFDCHSIRSRIPFLFEGTLPALNVGTDNGRTCAPALQEIMQEHVERSGLTQVVNGRFRGGWTTRHYGQPQDHVHAIQLEIAQSAYLTHEHAPWTYDAMTAGQLRGILQPLLAVLAAGVLKVARHG